MIKHGKQTHVDKLDVLYSKQNVKFIKMRLFAMIYHRCFCFILNQATMSTMAWDTRVRTPGVTPYSGLYGEAPPKTGAFFKLAVN